MDDAADDHERASRQKVFLAAEVTRFGGGPPTRHRIKDLSATGAGIDGAGELRAGATVLISVGRLAAVAATVVWSRDGLAGVRFAAPIDTDAARSNTAIGSGRAAALAGRNDRDHQARLAGWMAELNSPYRKRD